MADLYRFKEPISDAHAQVRNQAVDSVNTMSVDDHVRMIKGLVTTGINRMREQAQSHNGQAFQEKVDHGPHLD